MCGIVGYIGPRDVTHFLLEGLHRLEYRGYDSAGVAVSSLGGIEIRKREGRVSRLAALLEEQPVSGLAGIGHTRWATHGVPSDTNSHPHTGGNGEVVLVHNGVIENYDSLRTQLQGLGYVFRTETDTEAIAHLVAHHLGEQIKLGSDINKDTCLKAVTLTLGRLKGTYGLAVLFRELPDLIIAARNGSPLVVGVGKGEYFVASDASPLVGFTDQVVYLDDHELAVITADNMDLQHRETGERAPSVQTLDQVSTDTDLGDFEHYMLKEIYEQPQSIENAMRGRFNEDEATSVFGGLNMTAK
ncbi:MAG: class II glutamine amidotransferase, partial [Planctomycetaceae bacterium]|nr:class II glutamine amidotransferase [Planctomycetaceae bacterium]